MTIRALLILFLTLQAAHAQSAPPDGRDKAVDVKPRAEPKKKGRRRSGGLGWSGPAGLAAILMTVSDGAKSRCRAKEEAQAEGPTLVAVQTETGDESRPSP